MSAATLPTGDGEKPPPHAVCLPFPAQGHITPMLKLAKILHARGFRITFVNTEYNHRRLVRSRGAGAVAGLPGFRFATIPDGLPPSDADVTQDPASISYATKHNCPAHFRTLLAGLDGAVACVVADNLMSFSVDAAREMRVPCVLFWTASACGYMGYRNFRLLIDRGLIPLKDEAQLRNGFMDTAVDWAPGMSKHMRLKDFPSFLRTTDPNDVLLNFQLREVESSETAVAVVINTFDELERPALHAMRAVIPAVYTIAPLASFAERFVPRGGALDAVSCGLWREDPGCVAWLHGRAARSVVYVNYGSVTVMSARELAEFAWGLANSGHDFLWVVRPDVVRGGTASGSAGALLPPGFLEATEGRGHLASWCDQEAVLRHEAVGLFLTHSGWNSTVESLSAGVPMLCWPFFAEQQTNCRYKCVEWGVAMEVGDDVRREAVEARIREAMGGDKGKEMATRAAEWKDAAARAAETSLANLDRLINDVLLSGTKREGSNLDDSLKSA